MAKASPNGRSVAQLVIWTASFGALLTGCAGPGSPVSASPPEPPDTRLQASQAPSSDSQRLHALFTAAEETRLKSDPLTATFRGDLRYADRFGDYITDDYFAGRKAEVQGHLGALRQIDRSALSPVEQISYDAFQWRSQMALRGLEPEILAVRAVQPISQIFSYHLLMPSASSGDSLAPFNTVADYDNNLKRLEGFIVYMDRAIERMRQGLRSGVVRPKHVMQLVAEQLNTIIEQGIEQSPYFRPVTRFPESFSKTERTRLTAAYVAFIRDELIPAHVRLRDFIEREYVAQARSTIGLSSIPGGLAFYEYLVAAQTGTAIALTPEQLYQLGISEVARIEAQMQKVTDEVRFGGTLPEFAEFMRSNPRFQPESAVALQAIYYEIMRKVEAHVPKLFSVTSKALLEIRPTPEYLAKTAPNASYDSGTPDGSRPGVFYFNTYDLPTRAVFYAEALFLHEGIPGHHFQQSMAQENAHLPAFQRFGSDTAFNEGWALYAESLGIPLGLYTDPYQRYGYFTNEIFRAVRLVVDTGIHVRGWTREQAIDYMILHTAFSRRFIEIEVDRYISAPAQALAYKIGELTIQRLRARAEEELGAKFDVRAFHEQVLSTGSLPMSVLENKIERWIAASKAH